MSEINKENYLQKIAEIAKNKTIINCATGAYLPQKTPINKGKNKKEMKELQLKDPNTCENFKEFGCIKDNCNCYILIDGSKQETIEEAAENYKQGITDAWSIDEYCGSSFIDGAKWQKEKMYSEEDLKKCWDASSSYTIASHKDFKQTHPNFNNWLENFKKNKKK